MMCFATKQTKTNVTLLLTKQKRPFTCQVETESKTNQGQVQSLYGNDTFSAEFSLNFVCAVLCVFLNAERKILMCSNAKCTKIKHNTLKKKE